MRFLKLMGALIVIGVGLCHAQNGQESAGAVGRPKPTLGVALYCFRDESLRGQLDRAAETGLTHLEGFAFSKTGFEFNGKSIGSFTDDDCRLFLEMLRVRGLQLDSLYVVADASLDNWERAFAVARALRVKYITSEPALSLLDEIDRMAGRFGVPVAIHNHYRGLGVYWNPDVVVEALRNHPHLWACPDIGHWPKSGIDPVSALRKLEGRIMAIHLKDIAGYNDPKLQDLPLGAGVIAFGEVFHELERQRFSGWLVIEREVQDKPNNLHAIALTVSYLQSLGIR